MMALKLFDLIEYSIVYLLLGDYRLYGIQLISCCCAGEGGKVREHKTSFHAIARVVRSEGVLGLYNG